MYLKVVACEIFVREVCHVVASSPHICDVEFLNQGYHDQVDTGRAHLQQIIDATALRRDEAGALGYSGRSHIQQVPDWPSPRQYDAVLLGYGLCNNLIAGLEARDVPLVVPRAHDCITVLMGSKQEYERQFRTTPGTYYYSSGWIECRKRGGAVDVNQTGAAYTQQYEQFVAQYGEDNAKYLMEALGSWTEHYERGALIRYDFDRVLELEGYVRDICDSRGWRYEELVGDLGLLRRWVGGDWADSEFLTVQPHQTLLAAWDGSVIRGAAPAAE